MTVEGSSVSKFYQGAITYGDAERAKPYIAPHFSRKIWFIFGKG